MAAGGYAGGGEVDDAIAGVAEAMVSGVHETAAAGSPKKPPMALLTGTTDSSAATSCDAADGAIVALGATLGVSFASPAGGGLGLGLSSYDGEGKGADVRSTGGADAAVANAVPVDFDWHHPQPVSSHALSPSASDDEAAIDGKCLGDEGRGDAKEASNDTHNPVGDDGNDIRGSESSETNGYNEGVDGPPIAGAGPGWCWVRRAKFPCAITGLEFIPSWAMANPSTNEGIREGGGGSVGDDGSAAGHSKGERGYLAVALASGFVQILDLSGEGPAEAVEGGETEGIRGAGRAIALPLPHSPAHMSAAACVGGGGLRRARKLERRARKTAKTVGAGPGAEEGDIVAPGGGALKGACDDVGADAGAHASVEARTDKILANADLDPDFNPNPDPDPDVTDEPPDWSFAVACGDGRLAVCMGHQHTLWAGNPDRDHACGHSGNHDYDHTRDHGGVGHQFSTGISAAASKSSSTDHSYIAVARLPSLSIDSCPSRIIIQPQMQPQSQLYPAKDLFTSSRTLSPSPFSPSASAAGPKPLPPLGDEVEGAATTTIDTASTAKIDITTPKVRASPASDIFAACTSSGRTVLVGTGFPGAGAGAIGTVAYFEPAELLGSPVRCFLAGSLNTAPGDDEPCLIYLLATGEVLIFYQLRAQAGAWLRPLPLERALERERGLTTRLEKAHAKWSGSAVKVDGAEEEKGAGTGGLSATKMSGRELARWAAYMPSSAIGEFAAEIRRLRKGGSGDSGSLETNAREAEDGKEEASGIGGATPTETARVSGLSRLLNSEA